MCAFSVGATSLMKKSNEYFKDEKTNMDKFVLEQNQSLIKGSVEYSAAA